MIEILIVEDQKKIAEGLRAYLEREDYLVTLAFDGEEALAKFRQQKPALVILDLMLPKIDGRDVCRTIRQESNVPIIMLTARVDEVDKVVGLELGADDYMTKPFSPRELVARVRAVLRRSRPQDERELIETGDLDIDVAAHTVTVAGKRVGLTQTEFAILAALARHPGRVFTRRQLLEATQGDSYEGYERTIDMHVANLRKKIRHSTGGQQPLVTVIGVGYKFEPPAEGA